MQSQLSVNNSQISQLEETNLSLLNEIQSIKEKNNQLLRESNEKFQEQLEDTIQSKDKEIHFLQNEIKKLNQEIETLNNSLNKLQVEKKALEEDAILFNESKQAMSKYDWQMNEILQMVNEEKVVRGHLRSLASKLIEEVDSLRTQTIVSNQNVQIGNTAASVTGGALCTLTGSNSLAWKNRCSEKRERINAQNMQIALEKEFQAKEQLIEENNSLKLELDSRQHKIHDLQLQIDQINNDLVKNNHEIKELRDELLNHQKALALAGVTNARQILANNSHSNDANNSNDIHSKNHIRNNNLNSQSPVKNISVSTNSVSLSGVILPNNLNPIFTIDDTLVTDENNDQSSLFLSTPIVQTADSNESKSNSDFINSGNVKIPSNKLNQQQSMSFQQYSTVSSVSSSSSNPNYSVNGHKFEVVSFQSIERCEYCCGILYGITRQAVRCKDKNCNYLCHPKCRQYLPSNCPININQRVQLKGVDFTRGIGTLMQGNLKVFFIFIFFLIKSKKIVFNALKYNNSGSKNRWCKKRMARSLCIFIKCSLICLPYSR